MNPLPLRVLAIGALAASVAVLPQWLWRTPMGKGGLVHVASFSLVAALAVLLASRRGGRPFQGLPGLLRHVHASPSDGKPESWFRRSLLSLMVAITGGSVGPEGAAIEVSQGFASRLQGSSARWFEPFRRTDVATSLAAGVAAAFHAPFAAVMVPLELGVGGRMLPAVGGALVSFLVSRALWDLAGLPPLLPAGVPGPQLSALQWELDRWVSLVPAAAAGLVLGCAFLLFHGQAAKSVITLASRRPLLGAAVPAVVLVALYLSFPPSLLPAPQALSRVLSEAWNPDLLGSLVAAIFLGVVMASAGIGSAGILWPLFTLGAAGGWLAASWTGVTGPFPALAGAAALWGAAIGAPVAGALIAFELTRDPGVLAGCLACAWLAKEARQKLVGGPLVERVLEELGIEVRDGRSIAVLSALKVRQAMVADHAVVGEHEPVAKLQQILADSKYPFLCVITAAGKYVGLLTADVVHAAAREPSREGGAPLQELLEAKDLIYRAGVRVQPVRMEDSLVVTSGVFHRTPVVPVVGEELRVAGLLFDHNVRIAYEQEVARRSLAFRVTP
ncbi:MAG: chloride channel protein [Bdellovibrionales bacterium]|nr:chloride channel protein [Bdellovibrionales bacterium]